MTHKKLSARILSLVLTAAMVGTMMPQAVLAAEGDAVLGTSSTEKTTRTITAFDELGEGYTKSVPFDGRTYALTVKLGTPTTEVVLPAELGVTLEKTTTTTTLPAKDEVQDDVVDSGEPPKDTAPADEPTAGPEDKTVAETPAADEPASTKTAAQVADTDTTVSGNAPAPPVDEPEQDKPKQDKDTTVTETAQETIPVTWKGDREYTPDQNSKVIYTPVLPEGYELADGVKLPTIYVMVGKQARAANIASGTTGGCDWSVGDDGVLTISPTSGGDGVLYGFNYQPGPWDSYNATITSVVVEAGVKTGSDANFIFYNLQNCTTMDLSKLDTSNAIYMNSMFSHCYALTSLDLSTFNTAKVTDMMNMFRDCKSLTSIDLSQFDTSAATRTSYMFGGCSALTSLDVSRFNTANVTNMSYMFSGCSELTSLDVSNFNTSKVIVLNFMFAECSKLTSIDVSKFDTANVTNLGEMFYKSGVTSLDLSSFDTTKVTWTSGMLDEIHNVESIKFGANFTKPVRLYRLTKAGYVFNGWYTNPEFTGTPVISADGGEYTNSAETTVYTKWTSLGSSIKVGAQSSTVTYGTVTSPTYMLTVSDFSTPAFAPSVEWIGTAPIGVTTSFSADNATLTVTTAANTKAGEYKFKVVSPKTGGGNYESNEATLKINKRSLTVSWGSRGYQLPFNGNVQAPYPNISGTVSGDDIFFEISGGRRNVGTGYTATIIGFIGDDADNYDVTSAIGKTTPFSII